MKLCQKEELVGGTPEENAQITRDILSGKETGAKRDIVLLNAGVAIYLGTSGISMEEGVRKAAEVIDGGMALAKMEEFIRASRQ